MELIIVLTVICVFPIIWFVYHRFRWYWDVIAANPVTVTQYPVVTKSMMIKEPKSQERIQSQKMLPSPRATPLQYLKYIYLIYVPYVWSIPVKVVEHLYYTTVFKSTLNVEEKRQQLAKMVLETSLVMLLEKKIDNGNYRFICKNILMAINISGEEKQYQHINVCQFEVSIIDKEPPIFLRLHLDGIEITNIDSLFSILNTIWATYTHTLTHVQAGNIAEFNREKGHQVNLPKDVKASIDDMHSAVSGLNDAANHYAANIWGIKRKYLQVILGHNSVQQIGDHQKIVECQKISNFVDFIIKARSIYAKHLSKFGIPISTLLANTIFHSLDHYNLSKYMLIDNTNKSYLGIDSRLLTSLLGKLNYDLFRCQRMRYSKNETWRNMYMELKQLDPYLADKVDMFVSV